MKHLKSTGISRIGPLALACLLSMGLTPEVTEAQSTVDSAAWKGSATAGAQASGTPAPTPTDPSAATSEDPAVIREQLRRYVARQARGAQRYEVELGHVDGRVRLAPCERIEPFIPAGTRLWGRTAIGVRCVEGAAWTVTLPVHVRAFGSALVAMSGLPASAALHADQFRTEEVELSREPAELVRTAARLDGQTLTRPIAAGQALRLDQLRAIPTVAAGDPVRILLIGEGFNVNAEGVALAAAAEGQNLRVRLENGRIVAGIVRSQVVEIRL